MIKNLPSKIGTKLKKKFILKNFSQLLNWLKIKAYCKYLFQTYYSSFFCLWKILIKKGNILELSNKIEDIYGNYYPINDIQSNTKLETTHIIVDLIDLTINDDYKQKQISKKASNNSIA